MFFQLSKIYCLILFISLLTTSFAVAQTNLFSLQSLIEDVYKTHPFFKSTAIQRDMAKLSIYKEKSFTDTSYSIAPSFTNTKPVSSSPFSSQETTSLGIQSSVSKTLWSTGGILGASLALNSSNSTYSSQAQQFG